MKHTLLALLLLVSLSSVAVAAPCGAVYDLGDDRSVGVERDVQRSKEVLFAAFAVVPGTRRVEYAVISGAMFPASKRALQLCSTSQPFDGKPDVVQWTASRSQDVVEIAKLQLTPGQKYHVVARFTTAEGQSYAVSDGITVALPQAGKARALFTQHALAAIQNDIDGSGIALITIVCIEFVILVIVIIVLVIVFMRRDSGSSFFSSSSSSSGGGGLQVDPDDPTSYREGRHVGRKDVSAKTKVEFPDTQMDLNKQHQQEQEEAAAKGRQHPSIQSTSSSFRDYRTQA